MEFLVMPQSGMDPACVCYGDFECPCYEGTYESECTCNEGTYDNCTVNVCISLSSCKSLGCNTKANIDLPFNL